MGNLEEKEPYFQVPKSLFRLRRNGGISLTAFDIYLLMSDRFRLSKKNGWIDEEGDTYIMYSYEELCEELNLKRRNSISEAIKELEKLNLIEKKRRYNRSNVYYLIDISDSNNNVTSNSNEKVTTISNENVTSNSNENVYTNNNYNNNNYMSNNYKNNNNKENVAGIIRQEIKFLIKNRKIKIENIIKYSNDLERIKQVFEYADKNKKGDGWIIACLRDNYSLNQKEEDQEKEKDYSKTMDEILRGG